MGGAKPSKHQITPSPAVAPRPNVKDGKNRSKSADAGERKPRITSTAKVQKQKILESFPHKVYDAKSRTKSETNIKTVGKEAAREDTTPLYKPKLPQPTKGLQTVLPIPKLQGLFGMGRSKSRDQVKVGERNKGSGVLDLRKDQKQSGEKPGSPNTKKPVVVLSSPLLKSLMADRKAAEAKEAAELAKAQQTAKQNQDKAKEGRHKPSQKKDGDHKLAKNEKEKATQPVAAFAGRFGFNPNQKRITAGTAQKLRGIIAMMKPKDAAAGASKFLKILRHKVHEGGDLSRLKQFGIPDQRQLLTVALSNDSWRYDFGGNLRQYYSPLLRTYIPNNMLERYRGNPPTSPCLTAVDITSLGQKASVQEQQRQKRKEARDKYLDSLQEAALSEKHYEFLRDLANNQPVSVPLTIMHDIAKEMAPMINDTQAFYNKHLGPTHECTEQASDAFIAVLNRVIVYNAM